MNDEKMAKDYNIEGGSVLHLVSHLVSKVCHSSVLFVRTTSVHATDLQMVSIVCLPTGACIARRPLTAVSGVPNSAYRSIVHNLSLAG